MNEREGRPEQIHRRTRADNSFFIGLFEWGSTPREDEIAAEEYMFFRGEQDLTEAHDHKDDRWNQFKQRTLAEEGKDTEGRRNYVEDRQKNPVKSR